MQTIQIIKGAIVFFLVFALWACNQNIESHPLQELPTSAPALNRVITNMPQEKGYQTFNTNCLTCHSASYILNQPNLPEKSWTAIVTKMQKTFGAPVTDSAAREIIQYLVKIKGKE